MYSVVLCDLAVHAAAQSRAVLRAASKGDGGSQLVMPPLRCLAATPPVNVTVVCVSYAICIAFCVECAYLNTQLICLYWTALINYTIIMSVQCNIIDNELIVD